jgi:hypothetical protein
VNDSKLVLANGLLVQGEKTGLEEEIAIEIKEIPNRKKILLSKIL